MKNNRQLLAIALLVWGALLSRQALSISRVGNTSIEDPSLGFSAELPGDLKFERDAPRDAVLLKANSSPFGGMAMREIVSLYTAPILAEFPVFSDLNRADAEKQIDAINVGHKIWELQDLGLSCGLVFHQVSGQASSLLILWATNKGIIVSSPKSARAEVLQAALARNIRFDSGACEWK